MVADESRTEKTICLAVSPSLKAYGIPGRARLFEVNQKVEEVFRRTGERVEFIIARPRMALYMEYSRRIQNIYRQYIADEDTHVYSVDEVFLDVTNYLGTCYKMSAHDLAMTMIRDVLAQTGITATAGIGTNLYLAKIAMDIVAKHIPADKDGVRIAELDETTYREKLWNHRPLTSFWRVGRGIAKRLEEVGIDTMGKLARASLLYGEWLYKEFGVNAELLIDHAWGYEPCTMAAIKAYKPATNSLSNGQVLSEPYTFSKARTVAMEMADNLSLELFSKQLVTDQIVLTVNYDTSCLTSSSVQYSGEVVTDYYGRSAPKPAHGSLNLSSLTSSTQEIVAAVASLFDRIVDPQLLVRRLNLTAAHVVAESQLKKQDSQPMQLSLFQSGDESPQQHDLEAKREKERALQKTVVELKQRFGKNALLKGLNFGDGATAIERNQQIGGHRA